MNEYSPKRRFNNAGSRSPAQLRYAELMGTWAAYPPFFEKIPVDGDPAGAQPFWRNGWFPGLDAVSIYALLATENPRLYVEIGSGNSTKFARRAITDHGLRARLVSINPHPPAEVDAICDHVIREPLEDVEPEFFAKLLREDVMFFDGGHRSFQNSDVTVFFTEIVPILPAGMIYSLHDICLPHDHPDGWRERFYNEQYMLHTYLMAGWAREKVVFPAAYVSLSNKLLFTNLIKSIFDGPSLGGAERPGGGFWLRRSETACLY